MSNFIMPFPRSLVLRRWAVAGLTCLTAAMANAAVKVVHFGPFLPGGYPAIYSPADRVLNGNFDADPLVDPDNPFATNPHVTGWTISPASEFPGTRNSNAGVGADGRGLRLGDANLIDVSQTLSTAPGQRLRLSFFFAVDGDPGNLFRAYAGDQLLVDLDGAPYLVGSSYFSQYIVDFRATGTKTVLDFQYQSPIGDQHLSNVTVLPAPVPEPQTGVMLLAGLGLLAAARRTVTARAVAPAAGSSRSSGGCRPASP